MSAPVESNARSTHLVHGTYDPTLEVVARATQQDLLFLDGFLGRHFLLLAGVGSEWWGEGEDEGLSKAECRACCVG